jgi:predicted metalloprotease
MRWQDLGRSSNIGSGSGGRGGMGGLALGGGGLGALAVAAVVFFLTGDPGTAIRAGSAVGGGAGSGGGQTTVTECAETDQACLFTSAILKGTEDVWSAEFARRGGQYQAPKLIEFEGAFPTACGQGPVRHGSVLLPGRSDGLY